MDNNWDRKICGLDNDITFFGGIQFCRENNHRDLFVRLIIGLIILWLTSLCLIMLDDSYISMISYAWENVLIHVDSMTLRPGIWPGQAIWFFTAREMGLDDEKNILRYDLDRTVDMKWLQSCCLSYHVSKIFKDYQSERLWPRTHHFLFVGSFYAAP